MKYVLNATLILVFLLPQISVAEEDLQFGVSTWVTQGQTKWRHDASKQDSRLGVPSSELDYQDVNSTIIEFSMHNKLPAGHELNLLIGTGGIDSGLLVDDDYLSASGAVVYGASQSGNHRFSRTHSDIDGGGLNYFKGGFSPKDFFVKNNFADLRFSFDFHYWEEEYRASGVRQIECTTTVLCEPVGFSGFSNVTVITNKVEWTGFGISMNGLFNITNNIGFNLDMTYYPLMRLKNEDTHHLRGDLAQNPSISMTGNGTGYDLLAGVKFQFSEMASAHVGYRVWERRVQNQTITFHGASGGSSSADLMDFTTRREGFIAGVTFQFQ